MARLVVQVEIINKLEPFGLNSFNHQNGVNSSLHLNTVRLHVLPSVIYNSLSATPVHSLEGCRV